MDETSEQTAGAVTREFQPDRQRDVNLLPAERESIKTAKILAKKASRRGKMSYVTRLINNVNKQVSENGEPRQVDFNIQSLKKAMTSFRDFNDEYVENLEDSDEIDRAFTTFLSTEDKFQQCIEAAESYLAQCRRKTSSNRSSGKSGKYSMSSSSTGSDRRQPQNTAGREKRYHSSECSAEPDPREKKNEYGASTTVKNETSANEAWQDFKIPSQPARGPKDPNPFAGNTIPRRSLNPLTRAPLQTPLIPERHIFPTTQPYSLLPCPPNVTYPNPPSPNLPHPSPSKSKQASNEPTRRQADPQPSTMRLPTMQLTFGGENIIPLGKFNGKKELWPRFIQTFKAVVDNQPYEPIVKLAILEQHVIGSAKDCIKGFPFDEKSYPLVLKTLEERFGDDDDLAAFHLGAIEDLPRVKEKETSSLRKFFDDLQAHIQILEAQGPDVACHLYDPRRLKVVLSKLPTDVVVAWTSYKEDRNLSTDIRLLCEWLRRRVRILEKADVKQLGETRPKHSIHTTLNNSSRRHPPDSKQCWLCQENHVIYKCQKFEKMDVEMRKQEVRNKGACFRCLQHGHMARMCRTNMNDKGRKTWTHPMLRNNSDNGVKKMSQESSSDAEKSDTTRPVNGSQSAVAMTTRNCNDVHFMGCTGLPVKMVTVIDRSGKCIKINCLEDPGSQVTLVTAKIANSLDLKQEKSSVTLSGIGNEDLRARTSVSLQISSSCGTSFFKDAYVVKKISHHLPYLNVNSLRERYKHLEHVEVQLVDGPIDLLIGQDCPSLLRQLEVRYGEKDEPYAVRTPLGWSICGPLGQLDDSQSVHVVCSLEDEPTSVDYTLRKFWEIETIAEDVPTNSRRLAEVQEQTQKTTLQIGNRYQVQLPWKQGIMKPTGSYDVALKRLNMAKRRLDKNPELKKKYHSAMEEYLIGGYAEKIDKQPTEEGWYLPHHPVISDTKNTKVRIVFDSAAKVKGVSLNDLLEKGPNLLNDLTGILLRFRRYKYAVAGDISKMFLQILLNPKDQVFHRFLWRKDPQYEPEIYQFKTVIFGNAPSPFLACHVIKRVLEDHNGSNVDVFNALSRNLYMDDLLHSCTSIAEAKDIVKGTCEVLEKGGFRMRNWISNDQKILEEITEERKKDIKQLGEDWQKVLGLNWEPMTDTFTFRTSEDDVSWTKRSVVSHISKVFHPCGFLAPFLITGKILLQDLWRRGLEWDDLLDEDMTKQWLAWHDQLPGLQRIKIPRHINADKADGKKLEVHVFPDASEKAMAAVAYLRIVKENGSAEQVHMLMAKTQVAPLRVMTIPRLELQSCLMAVKLMQFIEKQLDLPLAKISF